MSKRQFSDLSPDRNEALDSVSQLVRNAEDLLRAAQKLQQDIQHGRGDYDADHLKGMATVINANIDKLKPTAPPSKAAKLQAASFATYLTPWTPHDDASSPPPLPTIRDATLERAVFTHAGLVKDATGSYERLEWIGDAYLYLMSSAFIYQTFPQLSAGRCSQYREILIRNKTLGKYTQQYGFDQRLRLPSEFQDQNTTKKQYGKILGDVFEAYVAGVVLGDPEHGLSNAASWIKTLWRGELQEELRKEFRDRPVDYMNGTTLRAPLVAQHQGSSIAAPSELPTSDDQPKAVAPPKVRLAQAIGGKSIVISYRDQGEPKKEKKTGLPWYTVGVFLDGWGVKDFNMGYGSALNKKEAGQKAAQVALDNKKMLRRFEQQKKEFDAAKNAV
ncbi:hypothetical protein LQW54_006008 [Pestalotiopsis sp. IQ-011]